MIIELGELTLKHLILLIFPIFQQTELWFDDNFEEKKNPFFTCFLTYLSMVCCGIFYLIERALTKTEKDKENKKIQKEKNKELNELRNQSKENIHLNSYQAIELDDYTKNKKESREKKIFILLIAGIHLAGMVIDTIFAKSVKTQLLKNVPVLLTALLLILFSWYFLAFSLYIHQYFSLAIITICLIIFIMESLIYKNGIEVIDFFISILYFFSYEIFFCLADVIGKKYINTYMDSVYLFLFKIGIINLTIVLLYDIILYFSGAAEKYHGIFRLFKLIPHHIIVLLLNLFFCICHSIGLWLTIYYFSPCHFIILITLGDCFQIFIKIFFKVGKGEENLYEFGQKITFLVLYPILIFAVLIFNEILILNVWKLSYNVKKNIINRGDKDDALSDFSETSERNSLFDEVQEKK